MKSFDYVIKDELGIHARPAGLFVKFAGKFSSNVKMTKGDKSADCKRLFALMGLAVKCGDTITIAIDGSDEDIAFEEIEKFVQENL